MRRGGGADRFNKWQPPGVGAPGGLALEVQLSAVLAEAYAHVLRDAAAVQQQQSGLL
jgi:hypothetical protein